MNYRTITLAVALFCAMVLLLSGCSYKASSQDPASDKKNMEVSDTLSSTLTTQSVPESLTDLVLGSPSEGGYSVALSNGTDQAITGLSVCATGSDDFTKELMPPDASLMPNQIATLYTPAIEGDTASEADVVLRATADIQIKFADGSQGIIHQLSVNNLKSLTIRLTDGIVYVDYTIGDTTESTLESERALAESASSDGA